MADKNYTVDDILDEYSGKVTPKKSGVSTDVDIEDLLADISKTAPQKTEMIEDVLEIGDNSFAFDPGDITAEEAPAAVEETPVKPAVHKSRWSDVKLEFGAHNPISEKKEENISIPELREGKKTTTGTQALEEVLGKKTAPKEEAVEFSAPAEEAKPSAAEAPEEVPEKKPVEDKPGERAFKRIKPVSEDSSGAEILEGLIKLKKERGTPKPESKIPPKNRASIEDVELGIGKKVIPNTEVGIDDNATESERLAYLNAKRRERAKQLLNDEEEANKPPKSKDDIADFESFDQAKDMARNIADLKKSLVVRICILLVCAVVGFYMTFANDMGLPMIDLLSRSEGMGTAFLFTNVVLGLVACFVSYPVLVEGFKRLITLKPDSDSIASVSTVISLVAGILLLSDSELLQRNVVHIYIPVAILGLLINTIGKLLIVTRTERNFRYVSGGYTKYGVMHVDDENVASQFTKGALNDFPSLSTSRKTEFITDFIKSSYSADLTDTICKIFVPVATLLALVLGGVGYLMAPESAVELADKIYYAVSIAAGAISMMSAAGLMLVTNIPLDNASKKYLQSGGVMLGYSAVDKFCDTNSVLIDARDLFPDGLVDIVNLKPSKKFSLEEGILYAGSLCDQTESILRSSFYKMIKGKTEMYYPVESYIYEDGLGLSGWIQNKRVLFGNRQLMESHSVEGIPTVEKEKSYSKEDGNVLYLSIGGTLAMLFVVKLTASVEVTEALHDLEENGVTVVLRSVDSLLSLNLLTELFGVSPDMFKLLPFRFHADYDTTTSFVEKMDSPMVFSGRFASLGMLLCGSKRLAKSALIGVIVQMLSALLGLGLCLVLLLTGSFSASLTCTTAIVYCLIWTAITAVVQSIQKT